MEKPIESVVEKLVYVDKVIERPVEVIKIVEVDKYIEKPVEVVKFVDKIVEIPVEKPVVVEKIIEKPILQEKMVEVVRQIEIPVETVKIEMVEKFIDRIVEKEKLVYIDSPGGKDDDCMTEAHFCEFWNKLVTIDYKRTGPTLDCVSKERFMEILSSNINANWTNAQKALPKGK